MYENRYTKKETVSHQDIASPNIGATQIHPYACTTKVDQDERLRYTNSYNYRYTEHIAT